MHKADFFLQRNGLPSAVITRHPLGLGKSVQSQLWLSSRKSHLQGQVAQGRSLASASGSGQAVPLDKGPLVRKRGGVQKSMGNTGRPNGITDREK